MERERLRSDSNYENRKTSNKRWPKIPNFNETIDEIDPFIHRFELQMSQMECPKREWAGYITSLLTGRALNVLHGMTIADAQDYDKIKSNLMKHFECTEDGFHQKFRTCCPALRENFDAFCNRMVNYLDRWIALADVDEHNYKFLFIKDQIYSACSEDLVAFFKERKPSNLEQMKSLAEQYIAAHPNKSINKSMEINTAYSANMIDNSRPRTRNRSGSRDRYRHDHQHHYDRERFANKQEVLKPKRYGRSSSTNRDNGNRRVKCDFCFKEGHTQESCYKRNNSIANNQRSHTVR